MSFRPGIMKTSMAAADSPPLRVVLWSRGGAGGQYGGPGAAAQRIYATATMRDATRVTLVHGSAVQVESEPFADTVYLSRTRVGAHRVGGSLPSLATSVRDSVVFLRRAHRWLAEHAAEYDVFHGLAAKLLTLEPATWAARRGLTTVIKITSLASLRARSLWSGASLTRRRRARQLRAAGTVISISREITAELLRAGVPANRIAEIPNGVDVDAITPVTARERSERRRQLGLPDLPTVLFVGALVPRKNPHLLLQALAALRARDAQVVLLGPVREAYAGRLRALAAERGVAGRVVMPGFVTNVADYLAAADVFCLPSGEEGLPNAALEALAAGLPLVLTPFSGVRDLGVPDDGTGVLVAPEPAALATGLDTLLGDDATRDAMGRAGRALAERRFGLERVAALHVELFRSLRR